MAQRHLLARSSPPWRREMARSRRFELVALALAGLAGQMGRGGLAGLPRRRQGRAQRLPSSSG